MKGPLLRASSRNGSDQPETLRPACHTSCPRQIRALPLLPSEATKSDTILTHNERERVRSAVNDSCDVQLTRVEPSYRTETDVAELGKTRAYKLAEFDPD